MLMARFWDRDLLFWRCSLDALDSFGLSHPFIVTFLFYCLIPLLFLYIITSHH